MTPHPHQPRATQADRDAAAARYGDADLIRKTYEGRLLPGEQVDAFRNTDRMFATRAVRRGAQVSRLDPADRQILELRIRSRGVDYDLFDYLSRNRVAGLLILKEGRIALERYELGIDSSTRWPSMSMAKSVSTTLVGAAIQDRLIASVDDPITRYVSQLAGGAYEGVSIRDVLQMTSGVRWDDTHTNPASERRRMLELQIAQEPGAILCHVASQPRVSAPGTIWNYSTGETHVIGALLHAATGRWLADYLSEKIWSHVGMESDASWWLEAPGGLEVAGSGISATLRDYGRFGLFMMDGGRIGTRPVLPPDWVRDSTSPREIGGKRVEYGYMWWPVAASDGSFGDGAFGARGIFGQFIYVHPREKVVVVVLSSRSKPKGAEVILDNDFFNSTVEALA